MSSRPSIVSQSHSSNSSRSVPGKKPTMPVPPFTDDTESVESDCPSMRRTDDEEYSSNEPNYGKLAHTIDTLYNQQDEDSVSASITSSLPGSIMVPTPSNTSEDDGCPIRNRLRSMIDGLDSEDNYDEVSDSQGGKSWCPRMPFSEEYEEKYHAFGEPVLLLRNEAFDEMKESRRTEYYKYAWPILQNCSQILTNQRWDLLMKFLHRTADFEQKDDKEGLAKFLKSAEKVEQQWLVEKYNEGYFVHSNVECDNGSLHRKWNWPGISVELPGNFSDEENREVEVLRFSDVFDVIYHYHQFTLNHRRIRRHARGRWLEEKLKTSFHGIIRRHCDLFTFLCAECQARRKNKVPDLMKEKVYRGSFADANQRLQLIPTKRTRTTLPSWQHFGDALYIRALTMFGCERKVILLLDSTGYHFHIGVLLRTEETDIAQFVLQAFGWIWLPSVVFVENSKQLNDLQSDHFAACLSVPSLSSNNQPATTVVRWEDTFLDGNEYHKRGRVENFIQSSLESHCGLNRGSVDWACPDAICHVSLSLIRSGLLPISARSNDSIPQQPNAIQQPEIDEHPAQLPNRPPLLEYQRFSPRLHGSVPFGRDCCNVSRLSGTKSVSQGAILCHRNSELCTVRGKRVTAVIAFCQSLKSHQVVLPLNPALPTTPLTPQPKKDSPGTDCSESNSEIKWLLQEDSLQESSEENSIL